MPLGRRVVVGMVAAALVVAGWLFLRQGGGIDYPAYWEDPLTGMRFVLIEPRTFSMGTPETEPLRQADEGQHEVGITRPFFLAEHELTQSQWERLMGGNPSYFQQCGPECPVERVSWKDAQLLVERLNIRGRRGYRLPTEAEWELACRGVFTLPFGNRRGLGADAANVNGLFPYNAPRGLHRHHTIPVRRFDPNWAGLYDMAGNVWEWMQDEYCEYPRGADRDPVAACSSPTRVLRGGSWSFDAGSARCGARFALRPEAATSAVGLRLAHDVFLNQ